MSEIVEKLQRAGIISHVVEAGADGAVPDDALAEALLDELGRTVIRLGPSSFGVDLGVPLGEDAAATLHARLAERLGAGSVTLEALPPLDDPPGEEEARAIALVRGLSDSVTMAADAERPALRAMIDAGFALSAAELTAAGVTEILADCAARAATERDERLDRIEARLDGLIAGIGKAREEAAVARERIDTTGRQVAALEVALAERLADLRSGIDELAIGQALDDVRERQAGLADAVIETRETAVRSMDETSKTLEASLTRLGREIVDRFDSLAAGLDTRAETVDRATRLIRHGLAELIARGERNGLAGDLLARCDAQGQTSGTASRR